MADDGGGGNQQQWAPQALLLQLTGLDCLSWCSNRNGT